MSIHFLGAQDFCTPGPGGLSCIFMQDEEGKKAIRRELVEKETYYNILADRQRMNH